jgi:hypothetical protein
MNPRTIAARSAPLSFVAANEDHTPNAGFPGDIQDLCSLAMDQALGIEKVPLAPVVSLNSCLLDPSKNALWFTPAFGNHLGMASQALAFSMEMQMGLIALLAPHAMSHLSTVTSSSGSQDQPNEDELAYSMDIALGERFTAPCRMVVSTYGKQTQQKAEEAVQSMDIAIGERFAAPSSEVASSPAITPSRKRRVGERFGNRYRGAGGRLNLSYGSRKAHG